MIHNDPIVCFKSLAFSKENNTSHTILQYNSTILAEFIVQLLEGFEKVSILLVYRSDNFKIQDFIWQLTHLITFHKTYLVLGDFNINALKESPLPDTMRQYGYTLLGTKPKHIIGGLLDHVCIRNNSNFFR